MNYPNIINCSAKGCNNIPEWKHDGLRIVLCQICFESCPFPRHFKKLESGINAKI
jgi:hypothetical protein